MKLWTFLWANKWWWIVPMALVLVVFVVFVVLTDTGTAYPFIYN